MQVCTFTVYIPQSNGLVERMHALILQMVRSYLLQSNLLPVYWKYTLRHISECRNFVPHLIAEISPFEIAFGKTSVEVCHLRPLGCKAEFSTIVPGNEIFGLRLNDGINLFHEAG